MIVKQLTGHLQNSGIKDAKNNSTGANAACTITVTNPATDEPASLLILDAVQWSYSDVPTAGKLTVTDGATVRFEVDITAGGPGGFPLTLAPFAGNMVVTLGAGGGGITGKLNIQYHRG